ncbi:MAG: CHASE4 domain-containing protein, partial [Lentisphaerota bacterium]
MTIRKKTFLVITAVLIMLTLLALLVTGSQMLLRAHKHENRQIIEETERASLALNNMILTLGRATADYAGWDDTCQFIKTHDEDYIRSNLIDATLQKNHFGFMIFANLDGVIVHTAGYDFDEGKAIPVPAGLLALLTPTNPLVRHEYPESVRQGLLMLPEEALLVSSQPILNSQFEGPVQGSLLIGYPLNETEIHRLNELTLLNIHLKPITEATLSSLEKAGNAIAATVVDHHTIRGSSVLRDVFGKPALMLEVQNSRDIFQQALKDVLMMFNLLLILGFVAVTVSLTLMDRLVLARTSALRDFVNRVGTAGDLSSRIVLQGNDELTDLGHSFNRLLDRLEEDMAHREAMEEELRKQQTFLRNIIDSHPGVVCVKDRDGRYLLANQTLAALYRKTPEQMIG